MVASTHSPKGPRPQQEEGGNLCGAVCGPAWRGKGRGHGINPHFVLAHTKPLYGDGQAQRMGLSASRGREAAAMGQDTMQHWCRACSSTPGAELPTATTAAPSKRGTLLCLVLGRWLCQQPERMGRQREHLHTKQTSRPLGSTEHPALQQKGSGQQHSKAARPMPDHHRLYGSFLLCGWHRGCIWNRYGAAAIGLQTRVNVFVNSAQVRGESLAGQSYRRLVTLPFSPRVPAKFGFFSIMPLNLKPKSKQ